jgi:ribosomal protein S27AE
MLSVKRHARYLAQRAIRRGELIRQPCEVCGASPAYAHHDDYEQPLKVRWLCSKHQGLKHSQFDG